jgi:hypothetical protein
MTMDDIRLLQRSHDQNVPEKGIQQFLVTDILGRKIKIETNPFHRDRAGMFPLFTETVNIHLMLPALLAGKLSRKILYVNTRAPINMRRIFICQKGNFHGCLS